MAQYDQRGIFKILLDPRHSMTQMGFLRVAKFKNAIKSYESPTTHFTFPTIMWRWAFLPNGTCWISFFLIGRVIFCILSKGSRRSHLRRFVTPNKIINLGLLITWPRCNIHIDRKRNINFKHINKPHTKRFALRNTNTALAGGSPVTTG